MTDQGLEFTNAVLKNLCARLEIKQFRTTAYHPQTNSKCERSHFSVHPMLSKIVNDHHSDWPDLVHPVAMAYNSTVHTGTGYSPFELFYSFKPSCPLDIMTSTPLTQPAESADQYAFNAHQRLQNAYAYVRQHSGKQVERMKNRYDLLVKPKTYAVSDKVLLYTPRKKRGQYGKWVSFWNGPFEVAQKINSVNYGIRRSGRGKMLIVHINRQAILHYS